MSRPAPTYYEWLIFPNSTTFSPSGSTVVLLDVRRNTSVSCIVNNSIGQGESKQLFLNVHYAPKNVRIEYTRSTTVVEGNNISLQCTSNSNPTVTAYEWVVTQNTTTTRYRENPLVLQNVRRDTAVSCSATNSVGTGQSQQLSLSVNYAPTDVNVDYTRSSSVVEGGQISLKCTSTSRPAPTHYKWFISPNSTTFSPNGSTVVLLDVRRNTSVSCIVNNSIGQGESKQLLLNVHYTPKNVRIEYTRSSTVVEGNNISLQCTSNSNPTVTAYEWVVTQNTNTTRYRENPLVLQNVRRDTSVSCSASNSVGTGQSQQLSLSVNYAPTDVKVDYTGSSSVVEGGQISLKCTSTSRPAPTNYKWFVFPNSTTFSPSGSTVVLLDVRRNTSVSCIVTNSIGQGESKQLLLNVHYAPKNVRIEYTRSSTVVEGNKISLQCISNSNPTVIAYEWVVTQNTNTTRYRENPLVLQNVRRDTSVSCSATNSVGTGQSQRLSLSVNYPPTILPGSFCSTKNGRLMCKCQAEANPRANISWTVDGSSALSPKFNTTTWDNGSLTLSELTGPQGHNVTCTAKNNVGQQITKILFQFEGIASILVVAGAAGAAGVCIITIVVAVIVICKKRRHAEPSGDLTIAEPTKHERRCHNYHINSEENLYTNTEQDPPAYKEQVVDSSIYANYDL
ncbi:B-cell receptor CD22-like [Clarias gariepinus]|uniref:B-cell receptor CD22-like n=1 Tax=Clarias gariepinus TaxID=13013 RepID=UPI00234C271C|nr:B-cell receptor CD22-like [Clarias gariepinus]